MSGVQALHPLHDLERAVVVLEAALEAHRKQQVVGNLRVLLAARRFPPSDGLPQPLVGVGELTGRGAHAGEALEHVVAGGVIGAGLLDCFPGLEESVARPVIIALEVGGIAVLEQRRHQRHRVFLCKPRKT